MIIMSLQLLVHVNDSNMIIMSMQLLVHTLNAVIYSFKLSSLKNGHFLHKKGLYLSKMDSKKVIKH